MMTTLNTPATRDQFAFAGSAAGRGRTGRVDHSGGNSLTRLIEITRSNDRLVVELAAAQHRFAQAIAYVADPKSRPQLAAALVAHARKKQTAVLDQLRLNRSEALRILASGETPN